MDRARSIGASVIILRRSGNYPPSPDRSHPGPCKRPTSTSTAQIPSTTSVGVCFSDATCTHCSTGGSSPSTPVPGQSRSHQSSSAIRGSPSWAAGLSSCLRTCGHDSSTYKSMRRSLTRPGDNWLDKIRCPRDRDYPRWTSTICTTS